MVKNIYMVHIVMLSLALSIILSIMIVPSMATEPDNIDSGDSDIVDEYGTQIIGGSSDDSTGGRGVVTCEPVVNIAKAEKQKSVLRNNSTTSFTISDTDFGIYFINVLGREDEGDVILRAESLYDTSKCRKVIPDVPGKIYKNVNIWLGSPMIKGSIINFQVENSWLKDNNIEKQNITIFQWNKIEAKWNRLQSDIVGEDDTYTYFESITNGLSQFAITGITPETKLGVTSSSGYPKDTYPPTSSTIKGIGNGTIIGIGILVIIGIIVGFVLIKNKEQEKINDNKK